MNSNVFINISLDAALKKYNLFKVKKDYSLAGDFLVYTIGVLVIIYGEADIINPFNVSNSQVFERNILKYGLNKSLLNKFYSDLQSFYELDIQNKSLNYVNKNPYFMYVQEDLIEMFLKKFVSLKLNDVELDNFKNVLYSSKSNSEYRRNYNKIMTSEEDYVINYFNSRVYQIKNEYHFKLIKKNMLRLDVYEAFKLNKDKIDKLSQKDLDSINNQIFSYYHLNPIEPNINDKIIEAVTTRPGKLSLKIATRPDFVTIFLLIFSIACFATSGVLVALKLVGK